ncbi:uncharacterized protein LOC101846980 [Aplysia californica]|uniref:Uncharacterized protein LOC101846980 n=1 Tax=Aplysia californica TaxID=6500 RepID=A0ABM1A7U5_APLCA|nr:uncharacterized protein LOC101846980 [Aplysia californica]
MQKQKLRYLSTVSQVGHMLTSSVGVVCTIATCVLFAGPLLCVQSDPDTEKGDSPHHRNAKDFGEKQQSGLSKDFEDSAMDYDNESETFNLNLTMKDILKGFRVGATDSSSDSLFHSDYSEEVTGRSGGFDSSKKYKNNRVLINRTHSPLTNKQNSFIEKQSSQTPVQKYGNTEKDHSVTFDTSMDASSNRNRVKFTHVAYSTLHKTDGGSDYPDQSLIQKRRHKSHRILSSHRQTVENSRDVSVVTKKDSTKLSLTNTYSVQRRRGNERNNTEHTESQTQAEPRNASTKNAASSNLGTGYFRLNSTVSLNQNTPEDDNKHQEKASSNDTALFNEKRTSSNQQEIFQNPQLIHSEPGQSGSNNPQPTLISSNGSVSEFTHVSEPTNHVTSSVANSSAQPVRVQQLRSNVTNLLNMLMMGYDKRLRPDFGGESDLSLSPFLI